MLTGNVGIATVLLPSRQEAAKFGVAEFAIRDLDVQQVE